MTLAQYFERSMRKSVNIIYPPRSLTLTYENHKKYSRSWYCQVLFFPNCVSGSYSKNIVVDCKILVDDCSYEKVI